VLSGQTTKEIQRRCPVFLDMDKTGSVSIQRNFEARSCTHCYSGKAISTTYSECVFVALGIQQAMRMHRSVHLWNLSLYHIFPHYLINGTIFEK